jgi:hypothetical protein
MGLARLVCLARLACLVCRGCPVCLVCAMATLDSPTRIAGVSRPCRLAKSVQGFARPVRHLMGAARAMITETLVSAELFGSYSAKKLRGAKMLRDHVRSGPDGRQALARAPPTARGRELNDIWLRQRRRSAAHLGDASPVLPGEEASRGCRRDQVRHMAPDPVSYPRSTKRGTWERVPCRLRGYGAAGSASAWHAEGQGFESP